MATLKYPERLLQPFKNVNHFAQELYAMFRERDDRVPPADAAPAPDRPEPGRREPDPVRDRLPLSRPDRARREPGSSPPPANGTAERRPRPEVTRERVETKAVTERRREASHVPTLPPARARPAPAAKPAPDDARRERRPEPERQRKDRREAPNEAGRPSTRTPVPEPTRQDADVRKREVVDYRQDALISPRLNYTPGDDGGTTTFLGKVVSGSGDTYQVTLYPAGPRGEAGDVVEVTIPMIDPDDQIPAETWINPIFEFPKPANEFGDPQDGSVYSCQVPVWMP